MTANEIISKVDALQPNQYEFEQKLGWLSQVDGEIFKDVILTHEHPSDRIMAWTSFDPDSRSLAYLDYETGEEELIVGKPYCDTMYVYYLQAMIAKENAEIVKYQQFAQAQNAAYLAWAGYYNRTHMPRQPRRGNRLKF